MEPKWRESDSGGGRTPRETGETSVQSLATLPPWQSPLGAKAQLSQTFQSPGGLFPELVQHGPERAENSQKLAYSYGTSQREPDRDEQRQKERDKDRLRETEANKERDNNT